MICEAKTIAAQPPSHPIPSDDSAVSIRASWDAVRHVRGLEIPLRRPNRRQPSKELEQQYVDLELARQALADTAGIKTYVEFRQELGLGE
jgi:hypothetical protein